MRSLTCLTSSAKQVFIFLCSLQPERLKDFNSPGEGCPERATPPWEDPIEKFVVCKTTTFSERASVVIKNNFSLIFIAVFQTAIFFGLLPRAASPFQGILSLGY